MMYPFLSALHPIEGLFFGAGKAGVVVGVAALIFLGLLAWMWAAHRKLNAMQRRLDQIEHSSATSPTPITPQRS